MQAETSKGGEIRVDFISHSPDSSLSVLGLVIIDAAYGSIEANDEEKDLIVDVTVPVQALVRNSQLYVPGHRTKVSSVQVEFCFPRF
jgi:hypothetical protein